jgi:hypothetical protein
MDKIDITRDVNYMEGKFNAERLVITISNTSFESIEGAIANKEKVIQNFEKEFEYTRDYYQGDRNYSYNYGMLDGFREALNQ